MEESRKKQLKDKLETIKELKSQYYIGSKAAYIIANEGKDNKNLKNLEQELKERISGIGLPAEFCPDYSELEEAARGFDHAEIIIKEMIKEEYKKFTDDSLTDDPPPFFMRFTKWDFLEQYGLQKAKELKKLGIEEEAKSEAFSSTLKYYYDWKKNDYVNLFNNMNLPKEILYNAFREIENLILGITDKFSESRFSMSNFDGSLLGIGVKYDNLFKRLEREQILHKDDMQKIYLSRFVSEWNITNYNDFSFWVNKFTDPLFHHPWATKKELEYFKSISNRHEKWIKKFFK